MIALLALLNGIAKSARNGKALSWLTKTQSKKVFLCALCVLRGKNAFQFFQRLIRVVISL